MHTKVPCVKFAACGSLAEQSAHFLLPGNLCSFRTISSGPSAVFRLLDDWAALDALMLESYCPGFLSILGCDEFVYSVCGCCHAYAGVCVCLWIFGYTFYILATRRCLSLFQFARRRPDRTANAWWGGEKDV